MTALASRVASGVLALASCLSLAACEEHVDKAAPEVAATGAPAVPASPKAAASTGAGSRLDCAGGQMSIGTTDHLAPPKLGQGLRLSPTQLARGWFNGRVQSPYWASAGPFTIEQVDTKTKAGERKIRVDYRAGDARIIGTLSVLWDERIGWRVGGWRACSGPADTSTPPAPTAPSLVIYQAMFSPRAVSSWLDCALPGAGRFSVIHDAAAPRAPLTPFSPEQAVAKFVAEQSHQANPDWDEAAPPTPRYYYPRDPAASYRAVIDFVTEDGRAVASLNLDRWPDSDTWRVGFMQSCGYPPPTKKAR